MTMNRKLRRANRSLARKELRNAVYDEFKDTTQIYKKRNVDYCRKSLLLKTYMNSIYDIKVFDYLKDERFKKVAIMRQDEQEIKGWDIIQRIKNDIFGKESWAMELYPKESELQDIANIRWIFVNEGEQFIGLNK